MNKIVNFDCSKKIKESSHITLRDWLINYYNSGDLGLLFANLDSAMKYIHNKGYCIRSFNPRDVEILNNSLNQIRFNSLMLMPDDFSSRKSVVREDINKLVFLQIGIYAKCLNSLSPAFLKKNFNDFATFLPEDIVPYYRGVVERDASVYLVDYLKEKRKRDLEALEKEVSGSNDKNSGGKKMIKSSSAASLIEYDSMNTKVNDSIYKQLSGISDAAFISFMMIPTLVAILGLVFAIVVLFSR